MCYQGENQRAQHAALRGASAQYVVRGVNIRMYTPSHDMHVTYHILVFLSWRHLELPVRLENRVIREYG